MVRKKTKKLNSHSFYVFGSVTGPNTLLWGPHLAFQTTQSISLRRMLNHIYKKGEVITHWAYLEGYYSILSIWSTSRQGGTFWAYTKKTPHPYPHLSFHSLIEGKRVQEKGSNRGTGDNDTDAALCQHLTLRLAEFSLPQLLASFSPSRRGSARFHSIY